MRKPEIVKDRTMPNIVNKSKAMEVYGIGGTKMLSLLKEPDCPAIKEGKGWLINLDEFWPWLMERKSKENHNG